MLIAPMQFRGNFDHSTLDPVGPGPVDRVGQQRLLCRRVPIDNNQFDRDLKPFGLGAQTRDENLHSPQEV